MDIQNISNHSPQEIHNVWFPLSQLRPRQRPILSQNKAISVKDEGWPLNLIIALFLCRGRGICGVMETRPKQVTEYYFDKY